MRTGPHDIEITAVWMNLKPAVVLVKNACIIDTKL